MCAKVLPRNQHTISRKNIDPAAIKVLYRLHRSGFLAYMVGGSVRDLMLGVTPKDFDIVTDARPNRVKRLFRNSFLIGRRFRLVHVKFKDKIIETATFRRTPKPVGNGNGDLLIRRENTFGTPEEDAKRRDFTVNGLFYNIADFSIIDYVGGLDDLKNRLVRTIGDPEIRFQEDPVRMIRAIRIAARINLKIHDTTWSAIQEFRQEILKCAPARNIEEIFHLMKYGAAAPSMMLMHQSGLMKTMMPGLSELWDNPDFSQRSMTLLQQFDRLPLDHPFRSPSLMLATLFFPVVREATEQFRSGEDLRDRVDDCFTQFARQFKLSRRILDRLTQICLAQRWFTSPNNRRFRPMAFIQRNFFAETLTLAAIRMSIEPEKWSEQRTKWQQRLENADISPEYRQQLIDTLRFGSEPKRRSRRRKRRS